MTDLENLRSINELEESSLIYKKNQVGDLHVGGCAHKYSLDSNRKHFFFRYYNSEAHHA